MPPQAPFSQLKLWPQSGGDGTQAPPIILTAAIPPWEVHCFCFLSLEFCLLLFQRRLAHTGGCWVRRSGVPHMMSLCQQLG